VQSFPAALNSHAVGRARDELRQGARERERGLGESKSIAAITGDAFSLCLSFARSSASPQAF